MGCSDIELLGNNFGPPSLQKTACESHAEALSPSWKLQAPKMRSPRGRERR